jgi:formate C-acetyltransferase
VISSFTKYPLTDICNGGPLTMELHQNIFRNADGEEKVARLVQRFIERGGHQLQLNAVDPERLQAALEHPEAHRDLIVRVWGWSGRFVELDHEYQKHIMARTQYQV